MLLKKVCQELYGQITTPLTTLSKKEAFSWTQARTKYFENLKEAMCTTHVLATLEFTKNIYYGVCCLRPWHWCIFNARKNLMEKTYSNPLMKNKCFPYYMNLRNGALT
jgi:hypothetical protein